MFEESETIEVPFNIKEMYYNCIECSSPIELLYINERKNLIEFKCINDNQIKKVSIKEYLEKMKKFNYVLKITIIKNMKIFVWIAISIYAKNV